MARPIEDIPPFTGKAAKWLKEYLKTHTKRNTAQAQRDKEIAAQIKPLPRKSTASNKECLNQRDLESLKLMLEGKITSAMTPSYEWFMEQAAKQKERSHRFLAWVKEVVNKS